MPMSFGGISKQKVATVIVAVDGTGDTIDIQTGINMLPATGGVVYIKEGTYVLTSSVNINKDNVSIKGAGKSTNIKSTGSMTIFNCASYDGILIDSVFLDKFSAGNSKGIVFISSSNSGVFNCWIDGMGENGIEVSTDCSNMYIQNNYIENCGDYGITVQKATNITVSDNFIDNSGTQNMRLMNTINVIVRGNFTSNSGGAGFLIFPSGGSGRCERNIIEGNYCFNSNSHGFYIYDSPNQLHIIRGNVCYGIGGEGIWLLLVNNAILEGNISYENQNGGITLSGCKYNVLTGNVVLNNSQAGVGSYAGISLLVESGTSTTSDYNTISSNQLNDNQGTPTQAYGYYEQSGNANYNVVIGNVAQGNVTANFNIEGANDIYVHNQ